MFHLLSHICFRKCGVVCALSLSSASGFAQSNSTEVFLAAQTFLSTLSPSQSNAVIYAPTLTNAGNWSNFPDYEATRNGLIFSSLDETQRTAALNVAYTALSSTGTNFYEAIRAMDEYLRVTVNPSNYSPLKYYIAFVGAPSTNTPWLLQLSGHHASYNFIYNAAYISATPMFAGSEPNSYFTNETFHMPLEVQSNIVHNLRQTLTGAAQLAGQYTEVVFGVTPQTGHDDSHPKPYPTSGRGQLYSALTTDQQALVRAFIESYVNHAAADRAASLLTDYLSAAALAQTYVGYSGSTNLATLGSYFRVDGPRVWIEFNARPGVAYPNLAHWHSVWRDKLADYGAAFGPNTISTPNRLPTITDSPASRTNEVGTSTTFTVGATGQGTLFYQWQKNNLPIPEATNASFTIDSVANSDAASYRCAVWNFMGHRFSDAATLSVPTTNPPSISEATSANGTFALQVAGDVGPEYVIQGSTNLVDWEFLYSTNPAVMPFQWMDASASNFPARFFRVYYNP
ncbi:MAG TPA: DUF3500 domain-containing protein [Verrucomicrobiae bacterium]|nr:DUF3500 domain-containing protein [Verrucomicrobiae bacterium]